MVVFIGLNAPFGIFDIKVELSQFCKDVLIDWNSVVPYDDPAIERNVLDLIAPLVLVDLLNPISLAGIDI